MHGLPHVCVARSPNSFDDLKMTDENESESLSKNALKKKLKAERAAQLKAEKDAKKTQRPLTGLKLPMVAWMSLTLPSSRRTERT